MRTNWRPTPASTTLAAYSEGFFFVELRGGFLGTPSSPRLGERNVDHQLLQQLHLRGDGRAEADVVGLRRDVRPATGPKMNGGRNASRVPHLGTVEPQKRQPRIFS